MKRLEFILVCALMFMASDVFACTTAIISAGASSSGRPLLWKQRDASNEFNVIAHCQGEKYGFTALFTASDVHRYSAYEGANDCGFAIVNNLSYNLRPDSLGTVTHAGRVMRIALGTCRTVDDFENLLKTLHESLNTNFGVIDAYGGAAYFEAWDNGYTRFDVPEGGYLYRTNYSLNGRENKGKGYVRYMTAGELMGRQKKFSPEWLIDGLGRSFYNAVTGEDGLKSHEQYIPDFDYIPRTTSVSSIVIEGVGKGESVNSSVLWTSIGYTPACYVVPVWVAAGDNIPSTVSASVDGKSPANVLANGLMHSLHPWAFEGGDMYIDIKTLRKKILPAVHSFEKVEIKAGESLDIQFRASGFDNDAVSRYNAEAERRFAEFSSRVNVD